MSDTIALKRIEFPKLNREMYNEVREKGAEFVKSFSEDSIVALLDRKNGDTKMTPFVAFYAGERGAENFQDWCLTHASWFGCTNWGFRLEPIKEDQKKSYAMPYDPHRSR